MQIKFLPIFFGIVFALTLFFAVAAGAQEEDTGSMLGGGGGIQVQQSRSVQQQQVGPAAAPTPFGGPLAHKAVKVTKGKNDGTVDKNDVLKISGDYNVREGASITIEDADGTQATFVDGVDAKITETDNGIEIELTKEPTTVKSETTSDNTLDIDNLRGVNSTGVEAEGNNNNGGNNNNNSNTTDTTDTTGVSPAQTDTTGTTTTGTGETTTAADTLDSLADTTTADNANRGDNFRCDFFLRAVRDDRGALKRQYQDDELIVQRFEQCLSGDVLANTIPNRKLPFTGGPVLPLAGGSMLLLVAALLVGKITRR